ncbi:hypothetical protein JW935_07680 [candidate division KSB1 bacterium]|nr:hypothetical protein [candidate division KSB1 bacterium]
MPDNLKKHECSFLPPGGVYIVPSGRDNKGWMLIIQREATEKDLEENSHLEDIGDVIWRTELEITHCPYCGKVLFECPAPEPKKYGKFRHIDSSGWSSKVL